MAVLLDYQHVEVSFNGDPVVHDVSFQLHSGEILGLVGESGSGKSTLLKAAMGLLGSSGMVTRGDIWFEGKSLPDVPPKEMRRICGEKIGMIFQDCGASLSPTRTIGEQIIESMTAHRKVDVAEAKRAALELFEKLHFQDGERIWDSYPFELSGGMNQRAGIAIAMLMNPTVLLADEPHLPRSTWPYSGRSWRKCCMSARPSAPRHHRDARHRRRLRDGRQHRRALQRPRDGIRSGEGRAGKPAE